MERARLLRELNDIMAMHLQWEALFLLDSQNDKSANAFTVMR